MRVSCSTIAAKEYSSFKAMNANTGFPSSNHPEIIVAAFAGGSVKKIRVEIDPLVYAQLMTSNHLKSDLVSADGMSDAMLPPPQDADY